MDYPNNWDQLESEHNRNYDPCSEKCPRCGSENHTELKDGTYVCDNCDYSIKDE